MLFLQQLIAGIANGCIYACVALALVMVFQAIDHINFAQGEMAMFSTFLAWQAMVWGAPYWLAFVAAVALSVVFGFVVERVLFRPLHRAPPLSHLAAFIALYALLNSAAGFIWGHDVRSFPTPFGNHPLANGLLSSHQAGMIVVTLLCLACLALFFRRTRVGLHMRAAAANPESARLVGIRVGWMAAAGWGMGGGIGAVAGMLVAPVVFLDPHMMGGVLVYGLAAAVVGGLSSPAGAVIGGMLVGIAETMTGTFIPGVGRELKLPIALFVIVTVLVLRPQGLLGSRAIQRV